jgi:hypothetical protein
MEALTIKPNDPEVFVVQSFQCGFCAIYDNIEAAIGHREETNIECPDDHYWIESHRIRSN